MIKKTLQFSKIITIILIFMNILTWILGLVLYFNELDYFNYMLDFTRSLSEVILPYFCLSAADRMVYIAQYVERYFENKNRMINKEAEYDENVD